MVGCLQGRRRENAPGTVNKPLTLTWKSLKSSLGLDKNHATAKTSAHVQRGNWLADTAVWPTRPRQRKDMNAPQREALARHDAPFLAMGLVPGDPRSFEAHLRHAARLMGE